jgi:hypothetical protein
MDKDVVHVIIALFICTAMIISPAAALNADGAVLDGSTKNTEVAGMSGLFKAPTIMGGDTPGIGPYSESCESGFTPDSIIVRYREGAETAEAQAAGAEMIPGASGLMVVPVPAGMSVGEMVASYEADPDVLYAEPNYIRTIDLASADDVQALIESYAAKAESMPVPEWVNPDDDYFDHLWGLWNTGNWGDGYI